MLRSILLPSLLLTVAQSLTVAPTDEALVLANAVLGDGIQIISAEIITPHLASGIFTDGPLGISQGGLFTTGLAIDAVPGGSELFSTQHDTDGHPLCTWASGTETFDATVLTVKVNIPENIDGYQARVVFATVDTFEAGKFNDAMGIWIDGVQVAIDDKQKVISVESLEDGQISYPDTGSAYFASSPLYTSWGKISAGEHKIQIAICDSGDSANDSAAFVSLDPCVGNDCSAGVGAVQSGSASATATGGASATGPASSVGASPTTVPASVSGGTSLPSVTGGPKPPFPTDKNVFEESDSECEEWETDYETDGSDDEDDGHGSGKPGKPNGGNGSHKPTIIVPGTKTLTVTKTELCTTTTCDNKGCHNTVFPTPTVVKVTSTAVVECETITVKQCQRNGSCGIKTTTVDILPISKPTATPAPYTPKKPDNITPTYVHPCGSKDCLAAPVPVDCPVTIPAPANGGVQAPKPTVALSPVCRDAKCAGSSGSHSGSDSTGSGSSGSGSGSKGDDVKTGSSANSSSSGSGSGSSGSPNISSGSSNPGSGPAHGSVPSGGYAAPSGHAAPSAASPSGNKPGAGSPAASGAPVYSKLSTSAGSAQPTGSYTFKTGYTPPAQATLPVQNTDSGAESVVANGIIAGLVAVVAAFML